MREEERWDTVMESLDLVFAKLGDLSKGQQKMEVQYEVNGQVISQMIKDQQLLAKQLESTGQAVAQLSGKQNMATPEPQPSPEVQEKGESSSRLRTGNLGGVHQQRNSFNFDSGGGDSRHNQRSFVPKLSCPRLSGSNPSIWKAKCEDYFQLLNVPESMWTTVASLHMEDNAEKWMQLYK